MVHSFCPCYVVCVHSMGLLQDQGGGGWWVGDGGGGWWDGDGGGGGDIIGPP